MLCYLVEHSGRLVTPDEILEALWPETYVNPEVVRNYVKEIRKILGDSPSQPNFIETVPKRGYRFIASVTEEDLSAGRVSSRGDTIDAEAANGDVDHRESHPSPKVTVPGAEALLRKNFWKMVAAVSVLLVVAWIVVWSYRPVGAAKLSDKDTVLLADFDNKTGDAVFDDTLKQGLAIQLEQSPFFSLISPSTVNQTLKLMGRPTGDFLTPEVMREVCQRTGSKAILTGSIVPLGRQYVIALKAVNCEGGEVLADAQEQAVAKEEVLRSLDVAATKLRRGLGESLSSVQKYDMPLGEVTTSSLEALKAYSLGHKTKFLKGINAALPFYKRAVELDPNFASAYVWLSIAYYDLNERGRAAECARKAYQMKEKVSERERFNIEAFYYWNATGELEKAAQTYELWQQDYPRDSGFIASALAGLYYKLGNYEKSLDESLQRQRLQPNDELQYASLMANYLALNRLDDAEGLYKQAQERKLEGEVLLENGYALAFLRSDDKEMAHIVSSAMGKPGMEDRLLSNQADTETWYGRLKRSRELTQRAMVSAKRNDAIETAAGYQAEAALREVECGYDAQARSDANAAIRLAAGRDVRLMAALALARAGDVTGAEKVAAELDRTFPLDTMIQRYWLPTIRAAVALQRKDPKQAIELLQQASGIELGSPSSFVLLAPIYVRGESYLALHDGNRAAAEFQKFVDYRGVVATFPWGANARLGLARAYALMLKSAAKGDADKVRAQARARYQDFLNLWKDADADTPILKQAKAEYAKLN
jgi:DNA-binding winged helix-turn-helix (wHTH) protein/tetratricopeptide (TPR) repeat protein